MESAPQLVFQLYVLIEVSDWNTFNVTWSCVSAVASMVSLGWGVAAYSQALRYKNILKYFEIFCIILKYLKYLIFFT